MDYRIFKFRYKGIFTKKLLITENDKLIYTMYRQGVLGNNLEYKAHKNVPHIKIEKPSWTSRERILTMDGKKVASFNGGSLSLSFSVESHYGNYMISRDSILSKTFTISNSTTEIGKLSKKGIFSKEYGLALHPQEHVHFIIGLIGYLINTIKKREESG